MAPYLRAFGPVLLTAIKAVNIAVSGGMGPGLKATSAGLQAANKFLGESLSAEGVDELQAAVQYTLDAAAPENAAGGDTATATTAEVADSSFGATLRVANDRVQALVKKHLMDKNSTVRAAFGLHDMYTRTGQRVFVCAACRMRAMGTLLDFQDLDNHVKARVGTAAAASPSEQTRGPRPALRVRRLGGGTLQGMVHFARAGSPRPPLPGDVAAASGVGGVTSEVGVLEVSPCDGGGRFTVSMYCGPNITTASGGDLTLPPESRLARLAHPSIGGGVTVVGWLGGAGNLTVVRAAAAAGGEPATAGVAGVPDDKPFHFVFHDASSGVATYVRAPTVGDERWWWETVLASSM